jgi:hypothetical protein
MPAEGDSQQEENTSETDAAVTSQPAETASSSAENGGAAPVAPGSPLPTLRLAAVPGRRRRAGAPAVAGAGAAAVGPMSATDPEKHDFRSEGVGCAKIQELMATPEKIMLIDARPYSEYVVRGGGRHLLVSGSLARLSKGSATQSTRSLLVFVGPRFPRPHTTNQLTDSRLRCGRAFYLVCSLLLAGVPCCPEPIMRYRAAPIPS